MSDTLNRINADYAGKRIDALIDLQSRMDELASRLSGDDRMLVFEARSTIEQQAERLGRIATLAG